MPKAGESFTAPDGKTYKYTQGGKWREYVNGKSTDNILPGNTFAGGGGAAAGATGQSSEHQVELARAKQALQNQVGDPAQGGITQAQADAEFARLSGLSFDALRNANQAAGTTNAPGAPQVSPGFGQQSLGGEAPYKTPTEITNTQDLLNQRYTSQQQAINRPSEVSAFGQSTYVQNPDGSITRVSGVGNVNPLTSAAWTGEQFQNQSYIDRALQGIAGEGGANNQGQAGLLPQLRGMLSSGLDYSGFSPIPTADQFGADRQRVEDQLYKRFADVNEPQFQRQEADMRQSWANRGLDPNGEKARLEFEQLQRAQNDARQAARTQALGMGGQEQQRLYENSLTSRGQQIGEANQLRDRPMTDLRGLLSMVNPLQLPQFNQTANIDIPLPNFAGTADNFLNREAQLEAAKMGGGGGFDLAGAQFQANAAKERQNAEFQHQTNMANLQNQFAQQNKPGFGDYAASVGGSILGGFFSGLGNNLFKPGGFLSFG